MKGMLASRQFNEVLSIDTRMHHIDYLVGALSFNMQAHDSLLADESVIITFIDISEFDATS